MAVSLDLQSRTYFNRRQVAISWNMFALHILVGLLQLPSSVKSSGFAHSDVQDIPKFPWRTHTLFSAQCNPYFDWQTVGLMHSFRKAGQPGPITRLLSCDDEEVKLYKNLDIAPTHVVPATTRNSVTGEIYSSLNKPAGILHWLSHSEAAQNVDWVVILDADMVMRHPITPWEFRSVKGKPVAAYNRHLASDGKASVLTLVHTKHPELFYKVGGFLIHHIDDLRALAPLWLSKIEEVCNDKEHSSTKDIDDFFEGGCTNEMYGYDLSAAEIGLQHQIVNNVMIYPGDIPEGIDPPIIQCRISFNVSSWHFSKSEHWTDAILDNCSGLLPPPPFPDEVESITRNQNEWHAHYLSIECINTINEGLLLHHAKRGCPEPAKAEYPQFLLNDSESRRLSMKRSHALQSAIFGQIKEEPERVIKQEDNHFSTSIISEKWVRQPLQQYPKIHTIFSVECNDYFDWQTLGLYHSFQLSGQPGFITRLLSCTGEKLKTYKNMDLAPTHVVPSYNVHPLTGDKYPAINKPVAVNHWLSHVKLDVEYVVILDADMIMRGPITPWEFGASKGHPVSAAYGYLIGCDNELARLHTRYPEYCQKVGGIIIMHIDDLRLFAPLWLHKTEEVRADKAHWATNLTGDIYGNGWISEMYGYAFGAAELKLWHIVNEDIMLYPGYSPADGVEPRVLHYGLEFTIGNWSWDKHTWHYSDMTSNCWTLFPFPPIPAKMQYSFEHEYRRDKLNFECMKILNEALFLYHKRKGCKQQDEDQMQILEHALSHKDYPKVENGILDQFKHEKTHLSASGKYNLSEQAGVLEVGGEEDSETQIRSEKLLDRRGLPFSVRTKYCLICIWGIVLVLALLRMSTSHFRRTADLHKERMV